MEKGGYYFMGERIIFKMEGQVFTDNMPLHVVISGLSEFQNLVDRTYLVLSNRQRISASERETYRLLAHEFRKDSFWSEIEIFCVITQMSLPFVAQLTPKVIWDYTKETFSFLKLILSHRKKGQSPTIRAMDNGTVNICYGGNQTFNFNAPVIQIGKDAFNNYRGLTQLIENEGVNQISAGRSTDPEIVLAKGDEDLFREIPELASNTVKLRCEIFDFNKHKNVGKLAVPKGQDVPEGEYPFSVVGSQDYVQFVKSMLKMTVTVECIVETAQDMLGKSIIAKLQVLKVTQ
jgi:hypothetical protein